MTTCIKISTRQKGIHYWPNAPDSLSVLAHPHAHEFVITFVLQVDGDDRTLEFFDMEAAAASHLRALYPPYWHLPDTLNFGAASCEQIAKRIVETWSLLDGCWRSIEVSEDGLRSAILIND